MPLRRPLLPLVLLAALGLGASAGCKPPAVVGPPVVVASVDQAEYRLTPADLAAGVPAVTLRLSAPTAALDASRAEIGTFDTSNPPYVVGLWRDEVPLDPPVQLGPASAGRVPEVTTRIPLFTGHAVRILKDRVGLVTAFQISVTTYPAAGFPAPPDQFPTQRIAHTKVLVTMVPDPAPTPTSGATPCLATPGPNDPNGTPAPCPTATPSPRPSAPPAASP